LDKHPHRRDQPSVAVSIQFSTNRPNDGISDRSKKIKKTREIIEKIILTLFDVIQFTSSITHSDLFVNDIYVQE